MKKLFVLLQVLLLVFPLNSWGDAVRVLQVGDLDGISSAPNAVFNGGFEAASSTTGSQWTASGGSFAITSTTPFRGNRMATWDSSAASQTLTAKAMAVPEWLKGKNAVLRCQIKTPSGTATHTLQAYDGTNILSSTSITSSTSFIATTSNFIAPSSGNLYPRFVSVNANEPSISIDECIITDAALINLSQVNQATSYGSATYAGTTNCQWSTTSIGTFPVDSDCPTPTVTGAAAAPSTKVPGIRFPNGIAPGEYEIRATGFFNCTRATSNCSMYLNFTDGTTTTASNGFYGLATGASSVENGSPTILGRFSYPNGKSGDTTIQLNNAGAPVTTSSVSANQSYQGLEIQVIRYPTASETSIRADLAASSWSGYHDQDCDFATTSLSFADPSADASCTFTERKNRNFGTVTSAGAKTPGIVFTPIKAGRYWACARGTVYNGSAPKWVAFRLTDGTTPIATDNVYLPVASRTGNFNLCGLYDATSVASTTLKVQFYSDSASTADVASQANSQPTIEWSIFSLDQNFPAPNTIGSVTSNTSGSERIERATINISGASACSITSQSGTWIASASASSSVCTLTLTAGIFSSAPSCVVSNGGLGTEAYTRLNSAPTTSSIAVANITSGPAVALGTFHIVCMGAK